MESSASAPNLPGFYFDESKQKYFKISTNSFGIEGVVANKRATAQNKIENPKEPKIKKQEPNVSSLINTLITNELSGLKENRTAYRNSCFIASRPIELMNLKDIPDIHDIQIFETSGFYYMLLNLYDFNFKFKSVFLKFNSTDFNRKIIDRSFKVIYFNK